MPLNVGTIWNLPNFHGELYTASPQNTPFLSIMGGINGGEVSPDFEFPTSVNYALRVPAQPNITENGAFVAPAPTSIPRGQVINTTQIHQEAVRVSYTKMANMNRMTGLNTAGKTPNVSDELAWQIEQHLKQMANDIEFSFIQGAFQQAINSGVAARTRGMVAACQLAGGTNVNANGGALSLALMQQLFLGMFNAGADFEDIVLYVPGNYKQAISQIYGFAPADRNIGGVNIQQIETDFGRVGIVPSRYAVANTVLAIDVAKTKPVFQEIPGKGILFYEELGKTGASETGQLYGHVGLDHGPSFAHGRLFGIA
jgi:hypothetical protein